MPDDELAALARSNLRALVAQLLQVTAILVDWEEGLDFPRNRASGFVIERNGRYFVVSAGHAIGNGRWWLELDGFKDEKQPALLVPLLSTWVVLQRVNVGVGDVQQVDLAWAEIDLDRLRADMANDSKLKLAQVTLPVYFGPLTRRPSGDDTYAYVACNRAEGEHHPFGNLLERRTTSEVGMEYVGDTTDRDAYVFRLGRDHQGHAYYKGASGAPIADAAGTIVSIVLHGSGDRPDLYGARLAEFEHLIGAID